MVALVLTACSSDSASSPGATVPRSTPTTDPYAVPAVIDIAYLNRVFLALDRISGDATRLIVANRRITPEAAELLDAILTDEEFKIQAAGWDQLLARDLPEFHANPGDRVTTIRRIVNLRPDCVGVEVERDYSKVRTDGRDPSMALVSLVPHPSNTLNPTPWAVAEQLKSGSPPCE